jgi:hypothetical protein
LRHKKKKQVSGSHHLHSANGMFSKHPTFGLKTKKKKTFPWMPRYHKVFGVEGGENVAFGRLD